MARFVRRDTALEGRPVWAGPDWKPGPTFVAIGGNEENRVRLEGGRGFNSPLLLGFIELPRVAPVEDPIVEAINVEVLKRAAELEDRLWRGVVGMDAFDELLAELEATDPREW